MSDHIYKVIEVVGSSAKSSDDAIQQAISKSGKSLRNLDWFEVVETRGHIVDAKIAHYQVKIKIGFRLD
ncbi:MAG: dodecin domain-containing protein [Nitrosomonas sp.]|nr:dodecin domain-containing protein [Nitrosomonas sp.]MBP6076872.1 dodecin domain-containing protein [Nitrosomonas sp.]